PAARLVESGPAGELAAIDPVIFGGYLAGLRDESYHVEPDRPQNAVLRFLKGPGVRRYGGSALIAVVAFAVFVAAGYLVPLKWTGFPGTTLWNWLGLLLLLPRLPPPSSSRGCCALCAGGSG
ncbi:MAG TPA: hypothetical protein VMB74_16215, partial [Streptosporangiaceae bacterium]|nr:hypothetical protein [Streptosporangiaceae bacterium]